MLVLWLTADARAECSEDKQLAVRLGEVVSRDEIDDAVTQRDDPGQAERFVISLIRRTRSASRTGSR